MVPFPQIGRYCRNLGMGGRKTVRRSGLVLMAKALCSLLAAGSLAAATSARAQTVLCDAALKRLDSAIAARDQAALEREGFDIGGQPGCDPDMVRPKRREAALILSDLARKAAQGDAPAEAVRERYLKARRVAAVWPVVQGLADLAYTKREWNEAAKLYSDFLVTVQDPDPDAPAIPPAVTLLAYQRASETQMLIDPDLAPLPRTRAGEAGGLDAVLATREGGLRDLVPRVRLMPVTFATNGATMTPQGRVFAERWWESIRASAAPALLLAGHSDPRGNVQRNETLSLQRPAALASFLQEKGYTGTLTVVGYGPRCPKPLSPGSSYTAAEQFQIQRRVEIMPSGTLPDGYCRGVKPVTAQQ